MMRVDHLAWLQSWYTLNCYEDWQREYGIQLTTMPDPGWNLIIDLKNTFLENELFEYVENERTTNDWCNSNVKDKKFVAMCGPSNICEAVVIFRKWVERVQENLTLAQIGHSEIDDIEVTKVLPNSVLSNEAPGPHIHEGQRVRPPRAEEIPRG